VEAVCALVEAAVALLPAFVADVAAAPALVWAALAEPAAFVAEVDA